MLLRSSISGTKKFFRRTLENFRSFFSGASSYERLPQPKTPTQSKFSSSSVMDMNNNQPSYNELEKFYADLSSQWDSSGKHNARSRSKEKTVLSPSPRKEEKDVYNGSYVRLSPVQKRSNQRKETEEFGKQKMKSGITLQRGRKQDSKLREERHCAMEQKLRELEMLDIGNVDYILDIQEVLHYYSRLTCPAYLEIVDKFFMEVCSEFFGSAGPASLRSVNSRLKPRSMRS
ncbi:hypothetical protein L6164_005267 [Bauhinia variegata]|uniref:Uncharacterized protein n=1 Tax=Bauhinia variegata TaxID=167791 RepID=A0ACB9PQ03_BAUVA|nr:hypothetical protein L6164_005267 [Bauhinia variegata]